VRIPENINSLSLADAFTCYRDLGLRVYPVYPPDAKTTKNKPLVDAGKHPAVKEWWNYDPYDCDLRKYFGQNGSSFNIGTCPEPPILWVDLDSKPDKGASVLEWLAAHPELDNVPRHITRGGVHLMFLCDDLPRFLDEKGKPYFERLGAQLTDKVTAELFHSSHTNVVLPCSRHPVRDSESDPYFIYAWDSIDHEVPNITWKWLQEEFGFRAPEPKAKTFQEAICSVVAAVSRRSQFSEPFSATGETRTPVDAGNRRYREVWAALSVAQRTQRRERCTSGNVYRNLVARRR